MIKGFCIRMWDRVLGCKVLIAYDPRWWKGIDPNVWTCGETKEEKSCGS